MTTTPLQQLQAKIREACPDLKYECGTVGCHRHDGYHDTGLSHVLRAIYAAGEWDEIGLDMTWDSYLNFRDFQGKQLCSWNLTKPLEGQEESVHQFLFDLLCR